HIYDGDWPDVYDAVRGIRRVLDEYPDRMAVGEVFGPPEVLAQYHGGEALDGLHLAFNFRGILEDREPDAAATWSADRLRRVIDDFEAALPNGAWPNFVLNDHDRSRFISRHTEDGRGPERARVAAMLLLTVRGTPFIYYGEEIGMQDVPIPPERAQDPARFHRPPGRDPERTPMQWSSAPSAGFTTGEPWLPLGDPTISVASQMDDPASLLSLYRRLIWFRKGSAALRSGSYRSLDGMPEDIFAYVRESPNERLLIALNFGLEPRVVPLPERFAGGRVIISTDPARDGGLVRGSMLDLFPNEGWIVSDTV
ncbi:MAG: alpha-amylase family glycosyl hydrolase, partial [Dehalococcoidia bacterium]